jgi:amino acid permease
MAVDEAGSSSNLTNYLPTLTRTGSVDQKSLASSASSGTIYEERIVVETLDQGVFGLHAGVKNELGQECGEMLKPHLKSRHVVMISLGGVVGTGIFLGEKRTRRGGR